jgi:hypothetical protein
MNELECVQSVEKHIKDKDVTEAENVLMEYEGLNGVDALIDVIATLPMNIISAIARESDLTHESTVLLYIEPAKFAKMMVQEMEYSRLVELPKNITSGYSHMMTGVIFREDLKDNHKQQMEYIDALVEGSNDGFKALVKYVYENIQIDIDWEKPFISAQEWYSKNEYNKELIYAYDGNSLLYLLFKYRGPLVEDIFNYLEKTINGKKEPASSTADEKKVVTDDEGSMF